MKKMMIAAFAVAFAAVAQAAAVSWSSGTFANGFTSPEGTTLKGSTAYTMIVSFYSDSTAETLITTSEATTAGSKNGAYSATTADAFTGGTTYYVQAVIKANDGSATRETGIGSFIAPTNGSASINFLDGAGLTAVSAAPASWGDWQTSSVPEPTSALMLLVGLAGLALKRKVA